MIVYKQTSSLPWYKLLYPSSKHVTNKFLQGTVLLKTVVEWLIELLFIKLSFSIKKNRNFNDIFNEFNVQRK